MAAGSAILPNSAYGDIIGTPRLERGLPGYFPCKFLIETYCLKLLPNIFMVLQHSAKFGYFWMYTSQRQIV
ncbi:MAG: hypothetical protein ACI9VI_003334, partial [Candidatus Azotimanducaceae bacterium]